MHDLITASWSQNNSPLTFTSGRFSGMSCHYFCFFSRLEKNTHYKHWKTSHMFVLVFYYYLINTGEPALMPGEERWFRFLLTLSFGIQLWALSHCVRNLAALKRSCWRDPKTDANTDRRRSSPLPPASWSISTEPDTDTRVSRKVPLFSLTPDEGASHIKQQRQVPLCALLEFLTNRIWVKSMVVWWH